MNLINFLSMNKLHYIALCVFLYLFNIYSFADIINNKEIKLGVSKHSVKSGLKHTYEKGHDINLEYLTASLQNRISHRLFCPRIHFGINVNTTKATNMLYAGLTWQHFLNSKLFFELSLGGSLHDGQLKSKSLHKQALGSRFLFRESISFGTKLKDNNVSIFVEHSSNAKLAKPNPGITNVGLRLGFDI